MLRTTVLALSATLIFGCAAASEEDDATFLSEDELTQAFGDPANAIAEMDDDDLAELEAEANTLVQRYGSVEAAERPFRSSFLGKVREKFAALWGTFRNKTQNRQTLALCGASPIRCVWVYRATKRVTAGAESLYADGANGGRQDAARHLYLTTELTRIVGGERAKRWADAHEYGTSEERWKQPNERGLSRMDFANNAIGLERGASWVRERVPAEDYLARVHGLVEDGTAWAIRFETTEDEGTLVPANTCSELEPCGAETARLP